MPVLMFNGGKALPAARDLVRLALSSSPIPLTTSALFPRCFAPEAIAFAGSHGFANPFNPSPSSSPDRPKGGASPLSSASTIWIGRNGEDRGDRQERFMKRTREERAQFLKEIAVSPSRKAALKRQEAASGLVAMPYQSYPDYLIPSKRYLKAVLHELKEAGEVIVMPQHEWEKATEKNWEEEVEKWLAEGGRVDLPSLMGYQDSHGNESRPVGERERVRGRGEGRIMPATHGPRPADAYKVRRGAAAANQPSFLYDLTSRLRGVLPDQRLRTRTTQEKARLRAKRKQSRQEAAAVMRELAGTSKSHTARQAEETKWLTAQEKGLLKLSKEREYQDVARLSTIRERKGKEQGESGMQHLEMYL